MCASCLLLPIWDAFLEPTCRIIGDQYQKAQLFKTSGDFEAGKGSTDLSGNSRRSMAMFRLSSIISGLDKLASYITSSSSSSCDPCSTDELVELKDSVVRTRNHVMDSRGVIGDASVKLWLMELNNLVHLIDHILVESASEHQRSSEEQQPQLVTCRKRAKLEKKEPAPDVINFQVQEIRKRFHEMSADWAAIHLTESDVGVQFQQQRSSPSGFQIDESCIFGRDHDKNKVIELLFSDDSKRGNVSIISIVGMAGIGKTTLAQLAYSDPKICAHFTARGWVCVSGDIDAVRLLQAIIQSVTGKACQDKDLVTLERTLERMLKGTKFLLVLDDVKEDDSLWDCLWSPLLGAETSKIVVTSRNGLVSDSIQELVLTHHLSRLSEAYCWSLFRWFAFDGEDPNEHPNLVEIGRRIAAMCRGWPLAAKMLGVLLRFETDEDRWLDILQGEVLGLVGTLNFTHQPSDGAW